MGQGVLSNRGFFIDTFTLLRLGKENTGLELDIWLHSSGCEKKRDRNAHILLRRKFGWERVFLTESLDSVYPGLQVWLKMNRSVIERHWNNELSDAEVVNILCTKKCDVHFTQKEGESHESFVSRHYRLFFIHTG